MKNNESQEIKFTNISRDNHHIGFFQRVKRSIFNVEKYGEFLLEKTRVSVKYFFLLTLIIALVVAVVTTYKFTNVVNKAFNYIKYEMPNFTYKDGIVSFDSYAEGYDQDNDFYDIIDTNPEITNEKVEEHINKLKGYESGVIFLSDEVIISQDGRMQEYTYEDIEKVIQTYVTSKTELIGIIDAMGIQGVAITYFVAEVLAEYIIYIVSYFLDIVLVCVFGYLVSRIVGLPLNWQKTLALSFYAMTLSMLLNLAYFVVFSFTGFVIEYFEVMYLVIAYIYMVSAILIIKSDLLKQQQELQKIYKVEAEVKKELEEQKEKDKEEEKEKENKKEKKKKEKEEEEDEPIVSGEPDGSEI